MAMSPRINGKAAINDLASVKAEKAKKLTDEERNSILISDGIMSENY